MDIDSITRAMADVLRRITLAMQKRRGQQAAQLLAEPARTIADRFNLN